MKELQRTQNKDELEEAYKAQFKHLDERGKELKTDLKAFGLAKKKSLDFKFLS